MIERMIQKSGNDSLEVALLLWWFLPCAWALGELTAVVFSR